MSKYTIAGLVMWFFGGLLLVFQSIGSFIQMKEKMVWKSLTLVDVVGESHFNWIGGISWDGAQSLLHYIVTMPLYLLLFIVGILLFFMNWLTS